MHLKKILLLILVIVLSLRLPAQDRFLFSPVLSANYSADLTSDMADSSGTYTLQRYQLGFRTPLWIRFHQKDSSNNSNLFLVSALANGSYADFRLTEDIGQLQLYGLSAGLSAMLMSNRKNVFSVTAVAMNRGDETVFADAAVRFSGLALYRRIVSRAFNFHAGIGYSYFTGRALAFPSFGVVFKTGKKSRMNINFPARINFSQLLGNSFVLQAYLRQQGGYYGLDLSKKDSLLTDISYLRMREGQIGLGLRYKLSKSFRINADLGYNFGRSLKVANGLERKSGFYYNSAVENGPFVGLGIQYRFANRKSKKQQAEEEAEKEELLSDPDFYNLIVN